MKSAAWLKPRHGYTKLNVDVGFDIDSLEGSVGLFYVTMKENLLRQQMEKMIYALTRSLESYCCEIWDEPSSHRWLQ